MQIDHLDHLVLTVTNLDVTCDFYTRVLGMQVVQFAGERRALRFGQQKINLHLAGHEFEPKAGNIRVGSADLCFITTTPISAIIAHLKQQNVTILLGPVPRTGALHPLQSLYFRDPDGNLLEVANEVGM